ncbi:MAG: hypothetical protein MUE53_01435 [Chitinophagales bacterium]|jgi:hypothetical protein|nr:hypothetical protein [Chitinophagales bacterium]
MEHPNWVEENLDLEHIDYLKQYFIMDKKLFNLIPLVSGFQIKLYAPLTSSEAYSLWFILKVIADLSPIDFSFHTHADYEIEFNTNVLTTKKAIPKEVMDAFQPKSSFLDFQIWLFEAIKPLATYTKK